MLFLVLWGTGFPICLILMSLFFTRLAIHKVHLHPRLHLLPNLSLTTLSPILSQAPPGAQVTSCFLPVGPAGMGAYAILKLSADLRDLSNGPTGLGFGNLSIEEGKIFAMAIYAGSIPFVPLPSSLSPLFPG